MRGLHLKKRGDHWYYQRRRPARYRDVEPRALISFSLHTADLAEAKQLAAAHSLALDRRWREALARGISLASEDAARRYQAAQAVNRQFGIVTAPAEELADDALVARLRLLINAAATPAESEAVLGLVDAPELSLVQAFERFWDHIGDERAPLSADQQRVKRNAYLKSIGNFQIAVGQMPLYDTAARKG